jgi:hypothetical protein
MVASERQPPPATAGMSLAWFTSLGLTSLTTRYAQLNRWKKPPNTMSTSGGAGGRGPQGPLLPGLQASNDPNPVRRSAEAVKNQN